MKALVFTLTNRSRHEFGNHPLLFQHPQEVVPLIKIPFGVELTYVNTLPSPRLLATHMPFSLFPKSITNCGCRVVYICREPKDAFVSQWHFQNKINREYSIDPDVVLPCSVKVSHPMVLFGSTASSTGGRVS
jgi:estrone sulfotransferase